MKRKHHQASKLDYRRSSTGAWNKTRLSRADVKRSLARFGSASGWWRGRGWLSLASESASRKQCIKASYKI